VRLFRRRRSVTVGRFDAATGRWTDFDAAGAVDRDELTVVTFNIWFDSQHAEQRYLAIADLLHALAPDVIALQEVTPQALDIFLNQPWVRDGYLRAAVVGGEAGNYGMLMLSRVPISRVTYSHLPSRQARGFLEAELAVKGTRQVICCLHLDSGKSSARLRAWQLRRIFRTLKTAEDAVLLGDFNMRDAENARITAPYCDIWPALRPHDDGFTEDTSINLMRYDMKNKTRQVRFDRVLLKGNRWRAASIELLGTQPISSALPRVFPSDHFGVACRLVRGPDGAITDTGRPKR
jgi:tyrosyl-DNA phosphodiesterase 2